MATKRSLLAMLASLALLGGIAHAQAPSTPIRMHATIEKIDGNLLTLKTRDGHDAVVLLNADARITSVNTVDISRITPGSYVGCAAVPQPDGTLQALEVTVFPTSMKGVGEGSRPWELGNNSIMTNGTVGGLVVSNGRMMTVNYNGTGEKKIFVPLNVPIVELEPSDRTQLKLGAHVVAAVVKASDGTLSAGRVSFGINGTVPPA